MYTMGLSLFESTRVRENTCLKCGSVTITLGLDNVGNCAHLGDGTNRSR